MKDANPIVMEIRRERLAHGGIVFDASLLPQAGPGLHDAAAWPGARRLEGRGGRGGAMLVEGPFGTGILRHYRRGGLVGRWNEDAYLYLGEERVRSLREFELLVELARRGLPVPRPVFASWRRRGLWYRADLLTCQVRDSVTLAGRLSDNPARLDWTDLGAVLARFHREGACHADLNAHNILIDAQDRYWLIDFDRGQLRRPAAAWQGANLARLRRSLEKLGQFDAAGWEHLRRGYQAGQRAHPGGGGR